MGRPKQEKTKAEFTLAPSELPDALRAQINEFTETLVRRCVERTQEISGSQRRLLISLTSTIEERFVIDEELQRFIPKMQERYGRQADTIDGLMLAYLMMKKERNMGPATAEEIASNTGFTKSSVRTELASMRGRLVEGDEIHGEGVSLIKEKDPPDS